MFIVWIYHSQFPLFIGYINSVKITFTVLWCCNFYFIIFHLLQFVYKLAPWWGDMWHYCYTFIPGLHSATSLSRRESTPDCLPSRTDKWSIHSLEPSWIPTLRNQTGKFCYAHRINHVSKKNWYSFHHVKLFLFISLIALNILAVIYRVFFVTF